MFFSGCFKGMKQKLSLKKDLNVGNTLDETYSKILR